MIPHWVKQEKNELLRSTAEEAYSARWLAIQYTADQIPIIREYVHDGDKALVLLNHPTLDIKQRIAAGEKAREQYEKAKEAARDYLLERR